MLRFHENGPGSNEPLTFYCLHSNDLGILLIKITNDNMIGLWEENSLGSFSNHKKYLRQNAYHKQTGDYQLSNLSNYR